MRNQVTDDRHVWDMSPDELDRHMDRDHDRDSGERGMGYEGALKTHVQLHRIGVWDALPHTHQGTLPFTPWRIRWHHRLRVWWNGLWVGDEPQTETKRRG